MTALRAFGFLVGTSLRNRLRMQLRRLRRPRHLIPVATGMLYFWWVFLGPRGEERAVMARAFTTPGLDAIIALLIAARAATWWLFGSDRSSLAFSPAEIHFLFPAPVTRRDLLQYRLLSVQLRVLVSVVLIAVLSRRGPSTAAAFLRALGVWTLLSTLHLHRLGASLARAGAAEHGGVGLRRNLLPLAVAGTGVAAVGWATVGAVRSATFARDPFGVLVGALDAPPAAAALFVFRLVVRPVFTPDPAAWLSTIGPALLVLALHYLWVLRSGVAFEDAAVEASARAAARSAARRGGVARQAAQVRRPRAGGWLPLASSGPPLAAMIWKNVVAAFRTLPLTTMLVVLALAIPLAATLGAVPAYARHGRTIGTLALIWTASLVAFGPQFVRNDLRQDLPRLAVLRSYPLDGREVVLAQLTASALVLTALIAPAVAVVYLAYVRAPTLAGGLLPRTALLVATLAALPVVSALALTVQNAAALLFPTWVRLGPTQRASGFEASGQNMVVTLLSLALLGVLLLAPALVVVVIEWALRPYLGIWAMAPAFPGGLAIAIAELWWVVGWLGGLFERTEPSEIG